MQQLYREYTGIAVPVYGAAMQAAYRCGKHEDAAKMYRSLRGISHAKINRIVLLHAIKIYGKLQDKYQVSNIWKEVQSNGWVNKFLATARIDAASEMGDIEGAASVLEYLQSECMPVDEIHYSSAINACKNSAHNRSHAAAMYLLDGMIKEGLQPSIVTFTSLAGAHVRARLTQLEHLLSSMARAEVRPNTIFVETFLCAAVFQGQLKTAWTEADVAKWLTGISWDRLELARAFLKDVKSRGVKLTKLVALVDRYFANWKARNKC